MPSSLHSMAQQVMPWPKASHGLFGRYPATAVMDPIASSHENAGRRRRAGTRQGNLHQTTVLFRAGESGVRTRGSYFRNKFHRLKACRDAGRPSMAIRHNTNGPGT